MKGMHYTKGYTTPRKCFGNVQKNVDRNERLTSSDKIHSINQPLLALTKIVYVYLNIILILCRHALFIYNFS